jgi:hypothetical protein
MTGPYAGASHTAKFAGQSVTVSMMCWTSWSLTRFTLKPHRVRVVIRRNMG